MGTWGVGNFDSDDAGDYTDSFVRELIKTIENGLGRDISREEIIFDPLQGMDHDAMPASDILLTLCEHYRWGWYLNKAVVNRWRTSALNLYDTVIDELDPKPDYKIKRRQVIEDTFNKLEMLANGDERTNRDAN